MQKFVQRLRIATTAIIGLLTSQQSLFVEKMSQIVVRESSDFDATSSDDELSHLRQNDFNKFIYQMVKSCDRTDQRLVNLYKVRKAHQIKLHLGLNGFKKDGDDDGDGVRETERVPDIDNTNLLLLQLNRAEYNQNDLSLSDAIPSSRVPKLPDLNFRGHQGHRLENRSKVTPLDPPSP